MKPVGILGGGQLARMIALAGHPLGVRCRVIDPSPDAPAAAEPPLRAAYEGLRDLGIGADAGQAAAYLARALLGLSGATAQSSAAKQVVSRGLSVRETEALVRKLLNPVSKAGNSPVMDPDIRRLQDDLGEKLAAKVAIQHTAKGKGKLVISYNSVDELDGILGRIK